MSGRKSKQRRHGARVTEAEKKAMFYLARTGKNYKDIGEFIGVSGGVVQHHVVRMEAAEVVLLLQDAEPTPAPPSLVEHLLEVGG